MKKDFDKVRLINPNAYCNDVSIDSNMFDERMRICKEVERIQINLQTLLKKIDTRMSALEKMNNEHDQFLVAGQKLKDMAFDLFRAVQQFCNQRQFVVVFQWVNPNHNDESFLYARFVSGVYRQYNPNFELHGDVYDKEESMIEHFKLNARK